MVKILHLEDNQTDSRLIKSLLDELKTEIDWHLVNSEEDYKQALNHHHYDLIFSDHNLNQFSSLKALQLREQICPEVPFILVSGTLTEESAINALHYGATDFVLKKNLSRLIPATKRALESSVNHREQIKSRAEQSILDKILQRKQLEELKTEKIARLTQLATGIASEIDMTSSLLGSRLKILETHMVIIKNLLQCLNAFSHQKTLNNQKYMQELIQQIEEMEYNENVTGMLLDMDCIIGDTIHGIHRMNSIARNLKIFSKCEDEQFIDTDINSCVDSALKILRPFVNPSCQIHKHLRPLPLIHGIPDQILQVFLNILNNTLNAIGHDGSIRIETLKIRDSIEVSFSDNGNGIPFEHKHKIFEPFFTTQPQGKHAGLGLYVCREIVRIHQGTIEVQSQDGIGSTFTVRFPLRLSATLDID